MEIILIILIVIADIGACALFAQSPAASAQSPIVSLCLFLVLPAALIFILKKLRRIRLQRMCGKCKKNWSLKRVGSKEIGKEYISIRVIVKHKGDDGIEHGMHEQYIPGTRTTYLERYKCRYCGNIETRKRIIDKKQFERGGL